MSEPTPYIFDVTTATFDQAVIEYSFHKPVLVDFWAEWCAPCKALMPLLAQVAESYQGELLLAKVDCEAEQDIVARFGIRSLPTVVLFKDGQPVDGFAGAQPESAVRAMLEPHVQMPPQAAADPVEQAQALFADGRISDAEAVLVALLGEDNTNAAALILYARCLAERGELGEAQAVLDAVKSDEHKAALAGAKAQITFLRQAADLPDAADLKAVWRKTRKTMKRPINLASSNWHASSTMRRWKVCSSCLSATAATAKACPTRRCCRCSSCWAMTTRWSRCTAASCSLRCTNRRSSCTAAYPRRWPLSPWRYGAGAPTGACPPRHRRPSLPTDPIIPAR